MGRSVCLLFLFPSCRRTFPSYLYEVSVHQPNQSINTWIGFVLPVITVSSLENTKSQKAFLMSQQDEEEESSVNAVSFPASILKEDVSTGKSQD